jgi:hypothetical protein
MGWSGQDALENGRYHYEPREYRKELEHTSIVNLDIPDASYQIEKPSEMKIYDDERRGTQWIN